MGAVDRAIRPISKGLRPYSEPVVICQCAEWLRRQIQVQNLFMRSHDANLVRMNARGRKPDLTGTGAGLLALSASGTKHESGAAADCDSDLGVNRIESEHFAHGIGAEIRRDARPASTNRGQENSRLQILSITVPVLTQWRCSQRSQPHSS
jgi:hypothetical protein